MRHIDWQELIPFYVAQTLPNEQRLEFELHLAGCLDCQREVQSWRAIAGAVWDVSEASAQKLPPLSKGFLDKLPAQPKVSARSVDVAPKPIAPLNPPLRARRTPNKNALPLTLVAGTIVAVFFGALLVVWGLNRGTKPDATEVALIPETGDVFGAPAQASPTTNMGGGILPTPTFDAIISTPDNTSVRQADPTTESGSETMTGLSMLPSGPYITLTPDLMESGYHLCTLFNPTTDRIAGYQSSSYDSPVAGYVNAGESYRTLIRSQEGWYQVVIPDPYRPLWIPPESAYLVGNCEASLFWIPTPTTDAPMPTQETSQQPAIMYVMVTSDNAPLYSSPDFSGEIIGGLELGDIVPVTAAITVSEARWLLVRTDDPTLGETWVSADLVQVTSAP